jgi:DNA invertase Pin-like site-specific DNA recombinase
VAVFGGTYESAKTDGRKEFMRMLEFIKNSKGKVNEVMVYALDRFSRTGGAAIKLANDLREKYGVTIYAVTQPVDTSNPSGVLSQGMHLLFSEFDNKLRGQRVVAGMKAKFEQGHWVVKPPQGFDTILINGNRSIVINEEGKKIKRAWEWKIQGMKNEEIIEQLCALGVKMYKQQLHKIFVNPFYCGMISHGLLNGKVVEGKHERMISKEVFLKVNGIIEGSTKSGVPHVSENENLPLKVFVWCPDCNQPFTGYMVKKKNLFYYKCRTKGCKCNRSVKELHTAFEALLSSIQIKPELIAPILYQLEHTLVDLTKGNTENERGIKLRLTEAIKKVDIIEEKHFIEGTMNKETYDKFLLRYREEQTQILKEIDKCACGISNLKEMLKNALDLCLNLATVWRKGSIGIKEKLQKLLFPEGLAYDKEIRAFRTQTPIL